MQYASWQKKILSVTHGFVSLRRIFFFFLSFGKSTRTLIVTNDPARPYVGVGTIITSGEIQAHSVARAIGDSHRAVDRGLCAVA